MCYMLSVVLFFFFQAEDGIRDCLLSRGLGDVYKRQDYWGIFQILDDDMPAHAEIPVPDGAHFPGDILKTVLFRFYPFSHP